MMKHIKTYLKWNFVMNSGFLLYIVEVSVPNDKTCKKCHFRGPTYMEDERGPCGALDSPILKVTDPTGVVDHKAYHITLNL